DTDSVSIFHDGRKWCKLNEGYPRQLGFTGHGKANLHFKDGASIEINLSGEKSLTENILDHVDAISDGIVFDLSKIESGGKDLFSIDKISIQENDVSRSVYFPKGKANTFKYATMLFDGVPLDFPQDKQLLVTPEMFVKGEDFYAYPHPPYALH